MQRIEALPGLLLRKADVPLPRAVAVAVADRADAGRVLEALPRVPVPQRPVDVPLLLTRCVSVSVSVRDNKKDRDSPVDVPLLLTRCVSVSVCER